MAQKKKRKLSEYDLCVRVIFDELNAQLGALVAMQKRYEERNSRKGYRSEPEKRIIIPKKSRNLVV
jgi:hypothetical protein